MESKQEFYAWIDYVNEVEISIKEILNDYGVSKEIRNDKNILNTYLLDMAYEKFIPKEKVFTAATLGYEMNIEPSTVGIYISFFIAFHELERQPKGLLSFFKKEKN